MINKIYQLHKNYYLYKIENDIKITHGSYY